MLIVEIEEAESRISELIDRVLAGEDVVLSQDGKRLVGLFLISLPMM